MHESKNKYYMEMSAKTLDDWEDDDDEEDFVPEDYDDEGDDFIDDNDEQEDHSEAFPSFLQGELFMDKLKGLCFENDGTFCLVCKTPISSLNFPFEAPVKESPLVFAGWIHEPNNWMEFEVKFSKEPISNDALQIQLLESQEQNQSCNGQSIATKTDRDNTDDEWMEKKSPPKGNLKAPPPCSLKEGDCPDLSKKCISEDSKAKPSGAVAKSNLASDIKEDDAKLAEQNKMVFVVSASQIGTKGKDNSRVSFHGAYRCPSKASNGRIHLICPIQTFDKTSTSAAGGTVAVAAAGTKRNALKSGDDDTVEGNAGVAYQELIDLHDDTRLSTDELRKRYYGSGNGKGEWGIDNTVDNKRFKGTASDNIYQRKDDGDDDDDDDDDAYGF